MKSKKLYIDMCAGSELKDTQGETLSVEGADISELEAGRGRFNDNHGKGFFNSLGTVTEAKKIFKAEDCENDRHKFYWEKIKAPYIYAKGYLYSNEDHPNAKAAAAILRNIHREDTPLKLKASVEGGVLSRGLTDPTRLARTKIHSVALTFTPANNATLVEPLNLDKSSQDWTSDQQLIKSVMHLAETNIPSFRHIERHASAHTIHDNINKIQELAKTLGIDIEIKESDPEVIMEKAVLNKIAMNVNKINSMVKAIGPNGLAIKPLPNATRAAQKVKEADTRGAKLDTYQQNIGQAKIQAGMGPQVSVVPNKAVEAAKPVVQPIKNAAQTQHDNILKMHANKAMTDVSHLKGVHADLIDKGVHPDKAQLIINKIRSHMTKSLPENFKEKLKKALTAGYGGAGSPTSMTGGSVIQTESLDDGRKSEANSGFKYVMCNNCGHEQIYMKHQVKCRDCKQNFDFNKLKNLI